MMGSRPDGWWRDRPGAAVRLHAEITALAARGTVLAAINTALAASGRPVLPGANEPPEFVMVLEGATRAAAARIDAAPGPGPASRVRVIQAAGSGDDAIVDLVRELPGRRIVVTADRELRRRCVAAGAEVLGPSWLIGLLSGQ